MLISCTQSVQKYNKWGHMLHYCRKEELEASENSESKGLKPGRRAWSITKASMDNQWGTGNDGLYENVHADNN